MEKGLNKNETKKLRKSYRKTHASKASLDQAIFKNFDTYLLSTSDNLKSSLRSPQMRNSYTYKSPKNQNQTFKLKHKKNKKSNIQNYNDSTPKYHPGRFTTNVTPNKSKCGSLVNILNTQNQISKFKFIYQIGFGGFGKVWKVMNKKTHKQFAMKQISKKKVIQKQNVESIINQRLILSTINHPFLINMYSSFQDEQNLYLIMDYLRGADLRYHICYKNHFNQAEIKFIVACIIVGLEYTHKNNIIHRDIKPENIVFEETGYVRITDFGIAKLQTSNYLPAKFQSSGTPGYMAPQILCKMSYSFTSDFFALGVIVYQLIMGHRPYQGKNRQQIRQDILQRQAFIDQSQLPKGFNKNVIDFTNCLLQRNPQERLGYNGIKQIKSHKWLKDIKWKALERKQIIPPFKPNVICQKKEYLQQIVMYNQMKTNDQNQLPITENDQMKFHNYDFKRTDRDKIKTIKAKPQENNFITNINTSTVNLKSKNIIKGLMNFSALNLNLKVTPSNLNSNTTLMKKNRRHSQEKLIY